MLEARGSGNAEYRCKPQRTRRVIQEVLWPIVVCKAPAILLPIHGNAGWRAHQVEMLSRGAEDRAGSECRCCELPNNYLPIIKHRQWAPGAAEAGADGEERAAKAMEQSSRVRGALRVLCRYQAGNANNSSESPMHAARGTALCSRKELLVGAQ